MDGTDRGFRCPGHAAVFPGLGTGADPRLSLTGHLGRQNANTQPPNPLHSRQLPVHPAGGPGHGLQRRGACQL